MEHVINAKLRNQAFWKFLFFFLLTIVIIVSAVYFDFRIPSEENAMLRAQVGNYQTQEKAQQQFIATMESAKSLIDSLDKSEGNTVYINTLIGGKLKEMTDFGYNKDNSIYGSMNKTILNVFLDYNNIKND